MATTVKWCSICRSNYRSSTAVHLSTAKHRTNVRRRAVKTHRVDDRPRFHIGRALAGDRGEDMQRIRAHRRSPPNDGTRKIVKVHRYWRQRAWSGWSALRARWTS